jgi:hypothetical protein
LRECGLAGRPAVAANAAKAVWLRAAGRRFRTDYFVVHPAHELVTPCCLDGCRLRRRFDPRELGRVVERRDELARAAAAAFAEELEAGEGAGAAQRWCKGGETATAAA